MPVEIRLRRTFARFPGVFEFYRSVESWKSRIFSKLQFNGKSNRISHSSSSSSSNCTRTRKRLSFVGRIPYSSRVHGLKFYHGVHRSGYIGNTVDTEALCLVEKHVVALEVLLQGLCGGICETLKVHEICLKSGPNLGAVPSEIHLLCSLSQAEPVWTVRHVGGAMRGAGADQLPALVRSVLEAGIGPNALPFLYALGYKLDFELLRTGFSFQFHRVVPISVRVSSIAKLPKLHAVDEAVPVTPNLQLVEVMAAASTDNYTEVVNAISSFAEFLAPLLHLSKPGVFTGVVPTAATAAASLISRAAMKMS